MATETFIESHFFLATSPNNMSPEQKDRVACVFLPTDLSELHDFYFLFNYHAVLFSHRFFLHGACSSVGDNVIFQSQNIYI